MARWYPGRACQGRVGRSGARSHPARRVGGAMARHGGAQPQTVNARQLPVAGPLTGRSGAGPVPPRRPPPLRCAGLRKRPRGRRPLGEPDSQVSDCPRAHARRCGPRRNHRSQRCPRSTTPASDAAKRPTSSPRSSTRSSPLLDDPYSLLVRVLGVVGLRYGEAVALERQAVDLLRRRLLVRRSVTEVSGQLVWGTPSRMRNGRYRSRRRSPARSSST